MNSKKTKQILGYVIVLAAALLIAIATGAIQGVGEIVSGFHIRAMSILKVIIMVCFVLALTHLIQLVMNVLKPKTKRGQTVVTIVSSLIQYAAAILILCWGLTILGVSVSTIFASVGILALIVGFGAESLIEDVITGLFMIFENQYNVGDIIEVGGFRGTVKRIGIRATVIADSSDNAKIINNAAMKNILNRSAQNSKAICDVGISYAEDLEKVEATLSEISEKILKENGEIFASMPEYLGVQELGDSAVILRVAAEVSERDIYDAARIMNREYYLGLKRCEVEIPYPQMDIHTR